ncbi:acetyltransferase [Paraconexibacter sp. AEG42_29]|uniref:Acetyltransferase n=1 Tax=Paraconexibacter sp. AEG42_29 TaxID=2997339 RepID=A0AAU7AVN4_9ACTN
MITRRATVADARPIAAVQLRAWWRNYQDIVDTQHFLEWDEESRAAQWVDTLVTGLSETFVAEVAGSVCGFATVGPSREQDAAGDEGELWALYVDPPAQGAGVGTRLMAEAEQALRAAGHRAGVLRTLRDNGLARTFYERHGWSFVDGSAELHHWDTAHVLYRREL